MEVTHKLGEKEPERMKADKHEWDYLSVIKII